MSGQSPDAQHRRAQHRRRGLCADAGHLVEQRHDVARRLQHPGFDLVAVDDRDGNGLVLDASAGTRARHDRASSCGVGTITRRTVRSVPATTSTQSRRQLVSVLRGDDREQPGGSVRVPTPDASVAAGDIVCRDGRSLDRDGARHDFDTDRPGLRLCRISGPAGKAEAEGKTSHEKGGQNGMQSGGFLPGGLPPCRNDVLACETDDHTQCGRSATPRVRSSG